MTFDHRTFNGSDGSTPINSSMGRGGKSSGLELLETALTPSQGFFSSWPESTGHQVARRPGGIKNSQDCRPKTGLYSPCATPRNGRGEGV
jgi:hypothetical protein